jgi:uncharacterized membrane protein
MIFFPVALVVFVAFILFLPLLFVLGYFKVITLGFENLGIPQGVTVFLLLAILLASAINIPLGKKKYIYVEKRGFLGLFRRSGLQAEGLAINLGGAVIPILISLYFLFSVLSHGFPLKPILITTLIMIIIAKLLARVVPGKGITLPILFPPLASAILAMIFAHGFAAPCAFISGTLGVLIGADLLNLSRAKKYGGFLSIGGAGVFDGIFLIGIASALLAIF